MLAALASAAVPGIAVAGARDSEHDTATDTGMGIDQAVVQDATGRVYDVYASDTEAGKRRLAGRVRAARTLAEAREPGGLGFSMEHVLAFEDGFADDPPRCVQLPIRGGLTWRRVAMWMSMRRAKRRTRSRRWTLLWRRCL